MSKKAIIIDEKTKQFLAKSNGTVDSAWTEKSEEAEVFDSEEEAQDHIHQNNLLEDESKQPEVGTLEENETFTIADDEVGSLEEVTEGVEEDGQSDEDLDEGGE